VADETTRSIYGETYPAYPKGTMNSIGFTCDDEIGPDGQTYQVNIHLDHVAVSPELIGRGGETVAVIDENDMAPTDPKEAEALKKEVEAKEAALKQKADEIERLKVDTEKQLVEARKAKDAAEAEAKAYKDQVDKIQKDEHDQLLAYCKARQKPGTTVSLDEVKTLDAAKWLKAYTDSLMVPSTADETNIGKSKEKDLLGGDATGDGGLGFPFSDRPKRGTL